MGDGGAAAGGTVVRSLELPAAAGEVWALVGDFDGLPRWNAGIERSELSEDGRRRTLVLKAGGTVVEELLHRDEAGRSLSYAVVDGPLPVRRHRATIAVIDRGPNQSTVRWSCTFEPEGVPVQTLEGVFAGIFERGLRQLADLFGAEDEPGRG